MSRKTYAISYGTEPGRVAIWCTGRKHANGTLTVSVINGGWDGTLRGNTLTVRGPGSASTEHPACLVWEGRVPEGRDSDYNDAIAWINDQLAKKGEVA